MGEFDENGIEREWQELFEVPQSLRQTWADNEFDEMWKEICTYKRGNTEISFPNMRLLVNIIRSLPHSNASAERAFSVISDIKTKKRNKTGKRTMNSLCVVKSALRTKGINAINKKIDRGHLNLMCTKNLYQEKGENKRIKLYAGGGE